MARFKTHLQRIISALLLFALCPSSDSDT